MLRRVAATMGWVWTIVLVAFYLSEFWECFRHDGWPSWARWWNILVVTVILGTQSFLCFVAAHILRRLDDQWAVLTSPKVVREPSQAAAS